LLGLLTDFEVRIILWLLKKILAPKVLWVWFISFKGAKELRVLKHTQFHCRNHGCFMTKKGFEGTIVFG
jgi:hypothetical protein